MIMLFEGLDNVGKTTLINDLLKVYPRLKVYNGNKKKYITKKNRHIADPNIFDIKFNTIYNLLICLDINKADLTFDRFYFSEYVYGMILRNYSNEHYEYFIERDKLFSKLNPILIYVKCNKEILKNRLNGSGEIELAKKISAFNYQFDKLFNVTQITEKYLFYNSNNADEELNLQKLQNIILRRQIKEHKNGD